MAERISFTRPAAQRIANAVRVVEQARDGGKALNARRAFVESKPRVFRVAAFTGVWPINSTKTVQFAGSPTGTVVATNLFFPVTSTAAGSRPCAVAKDGTAWYLVDIPLQNATAVFVGSTATASQTSVATAEITLIKSISTSQLTYVSDVSASLNTSNCAITVSKVTATAIAFGSAMTATASVISSVETTQIRVLSSTYTAAFLKALD